MKALFIGGIKSGKSKNAEEFALSHAKEKPIYLATTQLLDAGMRERIAEHKAQRAQKFITLEEPLKLRDAIATCSDVILVECVSMWINNMMYHEKSDEEIKAEIESIVALDNDIVFVINDVGSGIIPDNALARRFVDINGKIAQTIASGCETVFHAIAGISTKIK